MPVKVEKFPPDLEGRKGEEVLDGGWLHLPETAMKPKQGVLQHVVSFDPPAKRGEGAEPLSGQKAQPLAGPQQPVAPGVGLP